MEHGKKNLLGQMSVYVIFLDHLSATVKENRCLGCDSHMVLFKYAKMLKMNVCDKLT